MELFAGSEPVQTALQLVSLIETVASLSKIFITCIKLTKE